MPQSSADMPDTFLIITSIAPPDNMALRTYASECPKCNMPLIVIGDAKSPAGFHLDGCDFYSIARQKKLPFKLAEALPEGKYSRKNLGYLLAMKQRADVIVETDDDNFPTADFWKERAADRNCRLVAVAGWVNVYRYYAPEIAWPRGFALDRLRDETAPLGEPIETAHCPIQQGLCDENPDVDAIFRLVHPSAAPLSFGKAGDIALGSGSWCPFNSQNTTWFREAFPLMYLPSWCNFRMTDIWRSFIAQRVAWTNGWRLLFHDATVYQRRNEHDLLKDFEDEMPGYLNSGKICGELQELELKAGTSHIFENMEHCYRVFIKHGLIDERELFLLEAWTSDCAGIL